MKKISQSTLDFVNNNIDTNALASSYPIRTLQDIKITTPIIKPVQVDTQTELVAEAIETSLVNTLACTTYY